MKEELKLLEKFGPKKFKSMHDARTYQQQQAITYMNSDESSKEQEAMMLQYKQNERDAVKNPKDSFWTYFFLNLKEINKNMLALGPNLREWSIIAKKINDAEIFMVTDEETLAILKNQSLPAESGRNGSYLDFFSKDCGIKFVKTTDLINKLPEKTMKVCKTMNDNLNHLVKIKWLSMASKRDFADILVSMSGNKFVENIEGNGNCNGITFRFEPDIIANSQNAKKIAGSFLESTKVVHVMGVNIVVNGDSFGLNVLLNARTAIGEKAEIQKGNLNKKFCNDGSGNQVQASVEIGGKRGESLSYAKALNDASKLLHEMKEYSNSNTISINPLTRASLTRNFVTQLEQYKVIQSPGYPNIKSNVQASKIGAQGQILLGTWKPKDNLGKEMLGLITHKSDLSDVIKLINTPESNSKKELTWEMCEELINKKSAKNIDSNGPGLPTTNPPPSTTNKKLPEKYVAHETCPNPDHAFPSLKKAAALGFSAMSSNISRPSLTSISSRDFAMRQNLNPPSSKPTLNQPLHHQLSTLKQLSDDLGGVGHK